MARLSARGLLTLVGAGLAACAAPAQPAPTREAPAKTAPALEPPAPVRAAPTRPVAVLWPFTKIVEIDYVSLKDVAARYGLKLAWAKPDLERTLSDARGVRFRFERNQRDFYLDGVRVFMGEPVLLHRGELWVSKLDIIKVVAPLARPADHVAHLPVPPRVIVIDPGHGGTDPGKQNLRLKLDEKDMALDVGLRLRKVLEARGYKVVMTREKDVRFSNSPAVDLPLRAEVANKANADLFLSIHFNAVDPRDSQRVQGSETYILTPQFMTSTQPESDKTMTPKANPGNAQDTANAILGFHLHRQLVDGLKMSDRGFKRYRLAVLRTINCPGALVESAYLSNDKEAARVATPEFRQQIAEAIATGVQDYAAALAALREPAK